MAGRGGVEMSKSLTEYADRATPSLIHASQSCVNRAFSTLGKRSVERGDR